MLFVWEVLHVVCVLLLFVCLFVFFFDFFFFFLMMQASKKKREQNEILLWEEKKKKKQESFLLTTFFLTTLFRVWLPNIASAMVMWFVCLASAFDTYFLTRYGPMPDLGLTAGAEWALAPPPLPPLPPPPLSRLRKPDDILRGRTRRTGSFPGCLEQCRARMEREHYRAVVYLGSGVTRVHTLQYPPS